MENKVDKFNKVKKFTNLSIEDKEVDYIDENGKLWRICIPRIKYYFYTIEEEDIHIEGYLYTDNKEIDMHYHEVLKSYIKPLHDEFSKQKEEEKHTVNIYNKVK